MVTLVKFRESPRYRCPVPIDQNPEEFGVPLNVTAIDEAYVTLQRQLGQATYRGLQWVGEISEVFMETWVRDADRRTVQRDNRENLLQAGRLQLSYPPCNLDSRDQAAGC
jgi:hypothetical protein